MVLDLLPLPEEVRCARDWEIVAKWVEEHVDELEWDTEGEKFREEPKSKEIALYRCSDNGLAWQASPYLLKN